ncbi:MAG: hypothetical protein AAF989_09945 [Planctomycetota bacterium]
MVSIHTLTASRSNHISAFAIGLLVGAITLAGPLRAEDTASDGGSLSVELDLGAFSDSQIGKQLIEAGTILAADEMDKDPEEAMEALVKSIGFDPFEQQARLTAVISDLEDPVDGLQLALRLKNTTGNLEGLLLAAPGYRSEKHGEHTIHAVSLDDEEVFIAFHVSSSGERRVLASGTKSGIAQSLDSVNGRSASDNTSWKMPAGQFMNVKILSLPNELLDETPLTTISQMVSGTSLSLGEESDDLVIRVTLVAADGEKATQIQQLAQGAVAMVGLFKDEIRDELDEEVSRGVIPVLDQIRVERQDNVINIQTRIPQALVTQFLREEADLPL